MLNLLSYIGELAKVSWEQRKITWQLARVELEKKYSGSALGIVWAAVRPLTYVCVYWFAIEIGLRGGGRTEGGVPFLYWLVPGIFAWFFISEVMASAGNSVRNNSHLVTKMMFPVITIPQYSVLALFLVHCGLLVFVMGLFIFSGYFPTLYWLQLPYYAMCSFVFMVVLATFLSALTAISRDVTHIMKAVTQSLFWFSPVLWPVSNIKGILATIIKMNPIGYITEGYRATFVYHTWFFEYKYWTMYFWIVMVIFGFLTVYIWRKLAPDFADVL